ncbi:NAD(P)-binding Rossmann-fold superfamily protein [Rhynchospora pubera]|uniref:NAD(P)-binding Rossmann-fold superfamily protein n=1 Tax=Rhynchospora pubera TaxID=906938 RepID=A0AAV8CYD8_9POAL|nr:NAD(P)-binding Rossmann-fold superfamily protein [Rhynchospora pubera]
MEGNNRIALVTGGNRGIGFGICKQLAFKGVTVILTARDEKRGKEAIKELSDEFGLTNVIFHQLDVTDNSSIMSLVDFVKDRFGKLDILVNNAAVGGADVPQPLDLEIPWEERLDILLKTHYENYELAEACLKTNYFGVKYLTEALLPLLKSSDSGKVINVSSNYGRLKHLNNEELVKELGDINNLALERIDDLAKFFLKSCKENTLDQNGWKISEGFRAYKASKILLNAYTRVTAKNHPCLRVNCVTPGHVNTGFSGHTGPLTADEGAEGVVTLALADDGPTGLFYERAEISTF